MRSSAALALLTTLLIVGTAAPALAVDSDGDGLRDGFETRWGVTDPHKADTDGDGVVDSAEDNDRDRLGNLGEQRFGTNPGRRDSDGDGRTDGNEDKDRDGISNAREQDRRRLPLRLRPSLARAPADFPDRRWQCQTAQGKVAPKPCKWGDTSSPTRVVIFGDSHAAQWVPSLDRAGLRSGWKVIQMTKTACPSISGTPLGQYRLDRGRTCSAWRQRVFRWLGNYPPDVIVISNRGLWTFIQNGRKVPVSQRVRHWRRAMAATLAALPKRSKVVILADTPLMDGEPVPCLRRRPGNIAACATRRAKAMAKWSRRAERAAARAAGAKTRNLNAQVCTYDPCPLVQGRTLVWRDHGHLTATFSRRLWPSMRDALRAATDGVLDPAP